MADRQVPQGAAAAPRLPCRIREPVRADCDDEIKLGLVERLQDVADGAGLTLTQLALAWAGEHPGVSSVLLGPRTRDQLDALLAEQA